MKNNFRVKLKLGVIYERRKLLHICHRKPSVDVHVRWQENSEILQLKIICAHNSHNNGHHMELMMFNRDCVKISLAFVFIVAFVTHDFYRKEKIVKHTQIYSWI